MSQYNSMFHACEIATREKYYSTHVKYYSTHVKCHSTCVTWNFTCEVHIYTLQETWSTQTRHVNSISLCRVSLCVHGCSFEVIIEWWYCSYISITYELHYCYNYDSRIEILANFPLLTNFAKIKLRLKYSA